LIERRRRLWADGCAAEAYLREQNQRMREVGVWREEGVQSVAKLASAAAGA
jgi:hypothetical protein